MHSHITTPRSPVYTTQSNKEKSDQAARRRAEGIRLARSKLKHYVRLTQYLFFFCALGGRGRVSRKRPPEDMKIKVAESE
eukprot:1380050-Amorphochlora_amoeboformis.AAC.1